MAEESPTRPPSAEEEADGAAKEGDDPLEAAQTKACELLDPDAGGGPGALAVKVCLLEQDIERFSEGLQGLMGEAECMMGGMMERIGILHGRTCRLEAMLGLPVWGEDDPDTPSGSSPNSPRPGGVRQPGEPSSPSGPTCKRGHPLRRDEEAGDGPPRVCSFCRRSKQTTHLCSEGCYFHACSECVEASSEPRVEEVDGSDAQEGGASSSSSSAATGRPAATAAGAGAGAGGAASSRGERPVPAEDDGRSPCRASWPEGPSVTSRPPSRAPSMEDEPAAPSVCRKKAAAATGAGTSRREPETPSTDVPGEEEVGPRQAAEASEELPPPLPMSAAQFAGQEEDPSGDGPRVGRRAAKGGDAGGSMKNRLAAMEVELRELERRLQGSGPPLGGGAGGPSLEELEQVVGQLVQDEVSRIHELLQLDLERVSASSAALLETSEIALREDCQAAAAKAGQALRSELLGKMKELSQIQEEHAAIAATSGTALREECRSLAAEAGRAECSQVMCKIGGMTSEIHSELEGFSARLAGLEAELPRGRVRPAAGGGTAGAPGAAGPRSAGVGIRPPLGGCGAESCAGSDAGDPTPPAVVEGLAQGLAALARALGLIADNEMLGDGVDGWAMVGRRLEKAWAARIKDFWQLGLPSRPHLFDLLRAKGAALPGSGCATGATPSHAATQPLPDRREGARLATRLAAAVAFGSAVAQEEGGGSEDAAAASMASTQPPLRRASSSSGAFLSRQLSAASGGREAWHGGDASGTLSGAWPPSPSASPTAAAAAAAADFCASSQPQPSPSSRARHHSASAAHRPPLMRQRVPAA